MFHCIESNVAQPVVAALYGLQSDILTRFHLRKIAYRAAPYGDEMRYGIDKTPVRRISLLDGFARKILIATNKAPVPQWDGGFCCPI